MTIALVQQHATSDKAENIARGLRAFETAARVGAALVGFAELAFEPFYPQHPAGPGSRGQAEPVPGPTTDAFAAKARELGVVAVLNLFERAGDRTFDCSPVIDADGTLAGRTRMVHITEYACFHEQGYYTPGDTGAPVYRTRAGTIGVAICYDRHYPEYMRALAVGGADHDRLIAPECLAPPGADSPIHCRARLGGLLRYYYRPRDGSIEFSDSTSLRDKDMQIYNWEFRIWNSYTWRRR
jgi:beta-ureidopropionase